MEFQCPMGNLLVIPARLESTRLAQKALLAESGEPLILHTVRRASQSQKADLSLVATDSEQIFDVVQKAGFQAVMTRADHESGTDRVAEVAQMVDAKRIVNVQGDEPFIEPELIDEVFSLLEQSPSTPMATAMHPEKSPEILDGSGAAWVVCNQKNEALYFSRSLIPFNVEGERKNYFRHIGIYGFQKDYLIRFSHLPMSKLEKIEKLEQLRALENGDVIRVIETEYEGFSVNTPEEYQEFLRMVT